MTRGETHSCPSLHESVNSRARAHHNMCMTFTVVTTVHYRRHCTISAHTNAIVTHTETTLQCLESYNFSQDPHLPEKRE